MTVGVEDDNESELIDDNESKQKGSWEMARTELVIKQQGRESSCEFCHAHTRLPVIRIATINSNNPASVTGFPLKALMEILCCWFHRRVEWCKDPPK